MQRPVQAAHLADVRCRTGGKLRHDHPTHPTGVGNGSGLGPAAEEVEGKGPRRRRVFFFFPHLFLQLRVKGGPSPCANCSLRPSRGYGSEICTTKDIHRRMGQHTIRRHRYHTLSVCRSKPPVKTVPGPGKNLLEKGGKTESLSTWNKNPPKQRGPRPRVRLSRPPAQAGEIGREKGSPGLGCGEPPPGADGRKDARVCVDEAKCAAA